MNVLFRVLMDAFDSLSEENIRLFNIASCRCFNYESVPLDKTHIGRQRYVSIYLYILIYWSFSSRNHFVRWESHFHLLMSESVSVIFIHFFIVSIFEIYDFVNNMKVMK